MATPRKKPVKRVAVKTVRDDNYSALENYCIALNEYYKALKVAGFDGATALSLIMEKSSYPDWLLPAMPNKIDPIEYIDDEDED